MATYLNSAVASEVPTLLARVRFVRSQVGVADDPSAGLMVGTAISARRLTPTMKRSETKGRLLEDRAQLLKTLRDHDAGKIDHLGQRDRDHFVASVKRRIADLNEKIGRLDGEM